MRWLADPRRSSRPLVIYGLVAVVLVLWLPACAAQTAAHAPMATPTSTATPDFTATPAPLPGTGWRSVGPADLQMLYFSPSDTATAYTCVNRSGQQRGPLTFGVSHDGGQTWQFHGTSLPDTECTMAVAPTDANTIALAAQWSLCSGDGCATQAIDFYLSHDGGATWASMPPPGEVPNWGPSVQLAWVGTTLFVGSNGYFSAQSHGGVAQHVLLAASMAGAPFAAVGHTVLSTLSAKSFASLYALGASLYIKLVDGSAPTAPDSEAYLKTDAPATTLVPVSFTYQAHHIYLLAASADGKTLLGQTVIYGNPPAPAVPVLASTDGGKSWHFLPPFPQAQGCCFPQYLFGTPDGTIVAEIYVYHADQQLFDPTGILALRPGARAWTYVASPPDGTIILAVSVDTDGRPIAAWAPGFGNGLGYCALQ